MGAKKTTRIIAVGNQKGGVGKTTTAVHIAAALGERGRLCLLWDLDMAHNTTKQFGIPPDIAVIPPAYCLRLDCFLGLAGDEVSWSAPEEPLQQVGTFQFSFDPLRESVWPLARIHRGPLAVFLKVCSASSEVMLRTPISNTCGTIVDIG